MTSQLGRNALFYVSRVRKHLKARRFCKHRSAASNQHVFRSGTGDSDQGKLRLAD